MRAQEETLLEEEPTAAPVRTEDAPWHRFPRGSVPGNFLHEQLEWMAQEGFDCVNQPGFDARLAARCERAGWGNRQQDAIAWLRAVATTALPQLGAPLAALQGVLPEMEFWFPSRHLNSAELDRLCSGSLLDGVARPVLPERQLHGMLKGFADLVFEHEGRYWVLDYKSNSLGAGDAAYSRAAMAAGMAAHRYDIQGAIYMLALHRLLRSRLGDGYDPAQQLGGAVFLFLRGIANEATRGCYLPDPTWPCSTASNTSLTTRTRMKPEFWTEVDALTEAGELRRLSGAFARFIGSLGAAPPALMLACVLLSELEGRGHSCLLLDELVADPCELMGWSEEQWQALAAAAGPLPKNVKGWAALLSGAEQVWQAGELSFDQPLVLDCARLYLRRYWRDETLVAAAIGTRARSARPVDAAEVHKWLDILFASHREADQPDWQKLACAIALRGAVAIITGGPGTGKTYTVARLLALLFATAPDAGGQRIALAAPTGKAAARLKQSIDKALGELADKVGDKLKLRELTARMGAARTLHSLLGARPDTRAFAHNAGNPLDVDVLIVDEASMVHLEMMAALLDALPAGATLILLGDKDQLARWRRAPCWRLVPRRAGRPRCPRSITSSRLAANQSRLSSRAAGAGPADRDAAPAGASAA
jgi:hypothetical protein